MAGQLETALASEISDRLGLLRELNDLKRLYAYNLGASSFATAVFRQACEAISSGQPLQADVWCTAIVSAARLGAITPEVLRDVGLDESERINVIANAISEHGALPQDLLDSLLTASYALDKVSGPIPAGADWVERLAVAPRAGPTCPGKPRIALEPAEMHSDHCAIVAVYAYLLADVFGAEREDAWLIGLCHHFHNAYLPDAGFTGEVMLGGHLEQVIEITRARVIESLPESISERVAELFREIDSAGSPLAKTFHAADTIDRVVQMEHYQRASEFRVRDALLELNLVHEGAAQAFQYELLASIGLLPEPPR